jgi:hypothetical protein
MTVVAVVADVDADVVQKRGKLEPLPLTIPESVNAARLIEDAERETRHLLGVFGPVAAALGELDHASAPDVWISLDLANPGAVAADVIKDESFAKREIAEREVLGAEAAKNRVEEYGAGDVQIGAARVEAGHLEPFLNVGGDETLANPPQRFGTDPLIAQLLGHFSIVLDQGERTEAEDGARRADDAIEAGFRDLGEVAPHCTVEVLHQPPLITRRQRIGSNEMLGEADDTCLEASSKCQVRRSAQCYLDAAAADVNGRGRAGPHIHAVGGR